MKPILFYIILFCSVLLESVVTSLPITLGALLLFYIFLRRNIVFLGAFTAGLCIDILRINDFGISSIFFIVFLSLVVLYERKFEIDSLPFIFFSIFIGSLGYIFFVSESFTLSLSLINAFLFTGIAYAYNKNSKEYKFL